MFHRLRIGHPQAGADDTGHDAHQRHRIDIQAQPFEQPAQADHGEDETDRTPQADLTVASGLALQVGQGDDLELRQHGVPEEGMQCHHQRQPGVALVDEDQGEAGQGTERPHPHAQQALAAAIPEPAPKIGRHAAHQHRDGDQLADSRTGKTEVVEVQRQEWRGGTQQGEIEQVETGQAPVRQRHG